MDRIQGFVVLAVVLAAAVIVVKNHYKNYDLFERAKDLERKVEIYESMSPSEFTAIQESAATVMEEDIDFLQLAKQKLSVENIYDTCLANYKMFTKEQRMFLRSVDGMTEQEEIMTVVQVLNENGIVCIKDGGVYLTVRYTLSLYMEQCRQKERKIKNGK